MNNFNLKLINCAQEINIKVNENQAELFKKYMDILLEWNKNINLTAIEEEDEIIAKHFVDSLTILSYLKDENINLADVGTGAGFPGIPVKILNEKINVTLMDSTEKKIKFLNTVIDTLKLKGINSIHGRVEDIGTMHEFREKFDVCVARAVAKLPVLLEYCLPLVKVGGLFIAMKSNFEEEVTSSNKALEVLGGEIQEIKEFILPKMESKRTLIIIRKFRQTPTKYPRKAGKPSKEPLI